MTSSCGIARVATTSEIAPPVQHVKRFGTRLPCRRRLITQFERMTSTDTSEPQMLDPEAKLHVGASTRRALSRALVTISGVMSPMTRPLRPTRFAAKKIARAATEVEDRLAGTQRAIA